MSKSKAKKTDYRVQTYHPTSKGKKRHWYQKQLKMEQSLLADQRKVKAQQAQPPTDAQWFSANWKALQEILKTSPPEKKQSVAPKQQNGALLKKKAKANNADPRQTDTEKKVKQKTVSNSLVPKDSQGCLRVPPVSGTRKSTAPKRKHDSGKSNIEQAGKKQKSVTEERKFTAEDIWFDDVDPDDIEATIGPEAAQIIRKKDILKNQDPEMALVKEKAFPGLTKAVAIDCEMVGVGPDGEDSILARVSLVNQFGKCIYDKFVKPTEKVTDYRTAVSGIRPEDIKDGEDVQTVRREVAEILQGRIAVGHAIHNDLKILLLDHPKKKIRDTQKYKPFRKIAKSGRPSLKVLCKEVLNVKVQQGEHSSVQDAQATMRLYTLVKKQWEADIRASHNTDLDKKSERKPKLPKHKGGNPIGL
uniref:RNA exonuclease 4 n=1 Tax=Monopterus albus TaxID=43700 RepID=A0A3Q3KFR6_MONAL|nr:RNA exonuclease 4 [Monopterus albus]